MPAQHLDVGLLCRWSSSRSHWLEASLTGGDFWEVSGPKPLHLGQAAQSIGQVSFTNLQGQGFSYIFGSLFQSLTTLIVEGNIFPSIYANIPCCSLCMVPLHSAVCAEEGFVSVFSLYLCS